MIFGARSLRVFIARHPVDMRKGHDGLFALVRGLDLDPYSGQLFVFLNRQRNRAKILFWTPGGFCLLYKRLERSTFFAPDFMDQERLEISSADLAQLLDGVDPFHVRRKPLWEPPRR